MKTRFLLGILVFSFVWLHPLAAHSMSEEPPGRSIHPSCLPGTNARTKRVTHYMVPLLDKYNHKICHLMEGTCIYKKNGVQYLYNYGYNAIPISRARCKNGHGNKGNCLHPCRTVAASMKHHRFGQILFIKELVGKRCGNKKRDGYEMIHDGFVMVGDTGSPRHFNSLGRFDFFWGRCKSRRNGECLEGAIKISQATSYGHYCVIWDPKRPNDNLDMKKLFYRAARQEDLERGDRGAADEFDI